MNDHEWAECKKHAEKIKDCIYDFNRKREEMFFHSHGIHRFLDSKEKMDKAIQDFKDFDKKLDIGDIGYL